MPVIACINRKGGVGKTSTCHHLAGALAHDGHRVLLLDNDPQASLTQGLFGPDATRLIDPSGTVAAIYQSRGGLALDRVVRGTPVGGIDLVAGGEALGPWNTARPDEAPSGLRGCLGAALEAATAAWGYVLIDCPPDLRLCSWAALAAATHVLVPVQPEDYGSQGVEPVMQFIARVRSTDNPGLGTLGLLLTMVKRQSVHRMYEADIRDAYGGLVFAQTIPSLAAFPEAILNRRPVSHYAPRSPAAEAIRGLAGEIGRRLASPAIAGGEVA